MPREASGFYTGHTVGIQSPSMLECDWTDYVECGELTYIHTYILHSHIRHSHTTHTGKAFTCNVHTECTLG